LPDVPRGGTFANVAMAIEALSLSSSRIETVSPVYVPSAIASFAVRTPLSRVALTTTFALGSLGALSHLQVQSSRGREYQAGFEAASKSLDVRLISNIT
jgi:hypothetical protein